MSRSESLRGPESFQRVFRIGRKLDGKLINCFFLLDPSDDGFLRVGFAVSSRVYGAVWRNRLKRLMRESFRAQRGNLLASLEAAKTSVSLVFVFKGRDQVAVRRLKVYPVMNDVADLSKRLIGKLP